MVLIGFAFAIMSNVATAAEEAEAETRRVVAEEALAREEAIARARVRARARVLAAKRRKDKAWVANMLKQPNPKPRRR